MEVISLEQYVFKRTKKKDKLIRIGLVVGSVIFLLGFFAAVTAIAPLFAGAAYGIMLCIIGAMFYIVPRVGHEFDYRLDSGKLEIAERRAKRCRKMLLTAYVRDFLEFGKYRAGLEKELKSDIFLNASTEDASLEKYYATCKNEKGETVMLVFSPDERFLAEMGRHYKAR